MKRQLISLLTAALLYLSITAATAPVSADNGLTIPHRACTNPTVGFSTCYVQQADGMWAREELADTDATWVTVGRVTFDAVVAAVGEVNAIAP